MFACRGVEKIMPIETALTGTADYTRARNSKQFLDYQYFLFTAPGNLRRKESQAKVTRAKL